MMAELMEEMRKLTAAGYQDTGKHEGISASWLFVLGLVTLVSMLLGIGSFVFAVTRPPTPTQVVSPVIPTHVAP
jgi:hypothetical protein